MSQAPGLVWLDESDVSSLPKLDPVSDNKGSIGFAMGPNLPNTNDAPSGLWRVDLVSPDLSGDPQWVGANGVVAAFADTSTQFPVATPRIRFGFQVRKSDGSLYLLEEVNSAGAPVQHLLLTRSGKFQGHQEWYHLGANLPVTIGETIAGIRIKVYGAAVQPGSFLVYAPGYLALDNLIPIQ